MGGKHTLSNLVLLCTKCHGLVHRDEFLASLDGWIAWHDADVTPVLRQGRGRGPGWVLLVPDGTLEYLSHREGERLCRFVNSGLNEYLQAG
jgi:hypothetical protein